MQAQAGLCKSPQQPLLPLPPHLQCQRSPVRLVQGDPDQPHTLQHLLASLAFPGPDLGHFSGLLAPAGEGARRVRVPLCFPIQVEGVPRNEAGIGVMCIVSSQSYVAPRTSSRVRQVGPLRVGEQHQGTGLHAQHRECRGQQGTDGPGRGQTPSPAPSSHPPGPRPINL